MLGLALTLAACGVTGEAAALLERIVRVESVGIPYALNVNGNFELVRQPAGQAEAVAMARWLFTHGHNFDAGLAQVNSANFARLGLTAETALEPCHNLRAATQVLQECRDRAEQQFGPGEPAVAAALSCYNTGDFSRGQRNGYVAAVQNAGGRPHSTHEDVSREGESGGAKRRPRSADIRDLGLRTKDVFGQGAGT